MKILIQILALSLFALFSLSGNAQTKPNLKYVKPKYDTKETYKPSNKKKVLNYKSKQQQKEEDDKHVMLLEDNRFKMLGVKEYCQRRYANTDCEDMPSACHKYFSRCEDDDPNTNDAIARFALFETGERGGGEIPDGCEERIDNCIPDPRLRYFQTFIHDPRTPYYISIKTTKGKTIAYTKTGYGKKTIDPRLSYSTLKVKMPKYQGTAIFKITNLKTKKTNTFKTKIYP